MVPSAHVFCLCPQHAICTAATSCPEASMHACCIADSTHLMQGNNSASLTAALLPLQIPLRLGQLNLPVGKLKSKLLQTSRPKPALLLSQHQAVQKQAIQTLKLHCRRAMMYQESPSQQVIMRKVQKKMESRDCLHRASPLCCLKCNMQICRMLNRRVLIGPSRCY